jgi:hypothetical protein
VAVRKIFNVKKNILFKKNCQKGWVILDIMTEIVLIYLYIFNTLRVILLILFLLQFWTDLKDFGGDLKRSWRQVVHEVFEMKVQLMVGTLEAFEVHYFSIRLTVRKSFEIKHMFRINTVQQQNHMLIF